MIPTSTRVAIEFKERLPVSTQALALFITEGRKDVADVRHLLDEDERLAVMRLLGSGVSRGKAREIAFDLIPATASAKPATSAYRRVLVVGLGQAAKVTGDIVRQAAGALTRALRKHRITDAAVIVPIVENVDAPTAAQAVVEGMLLAGFHYDEYKGTGSKQGEAADEDDKKKLNVTLLSESGKRAELQQAVKRGQIIADAQNMARTIASRPGNNINPPALADVAKTMAHEVGLTCRVLDEKEMAKLQMGGILAVGQASATPPRMIVLEHKPGGAKGGGKTGKAAKTTQGISSQGFAGKSAKAGAGPLLVVGKAITFDTGGVSIKPADRMGKMIFDKCGAMAVLGFMYAVAKLQLPVHVVGIMSSAENTLSGRAYRPGDILRMYNGVTVEVTNTDAEGRLVLGDALSWGIETYKPAKVVDLATLTGGVIVALGTAMAGMMANDDGIAAELMAASERAGEKIWRLPLNEQLREQVKSQHADIVNSAGREAQPLQGGAFLSYFIPPKGVPWAHLDIAGVADTDKELPYYEKGATGWGIRTLIQWVCKGEV